MKRAGLGALCTAGLLAGVAGAAQPPAPAKSMRAEHVPSDDLPTDGMAAAWLHEILGSEPRTVLDAYRSVVEDEDEPQPQRMRAAARAVPIAAALGDENTALWFLRSLTERMTWPDDVEPTALLDRLQALQHAGRSWAESAAADADARAAMQRLGAEPWRTLDALASRPQPIADSPERRLRAAEARGDEEEAARLRDEVQRRATTGDARPRAVQLRRWARDILVWELAGEREKATRMFPALRRRMGRQTLTLQRLETEMQTAPFARLPQSDQELLARALAQARQRVANGNAREAILLIGPALVLLRPAD